MKRWPYPCLRQCGKTTAEPGQICQSCAAKEAWQIRRARQIAVQAAMNTKGDD